MIDLWDTTPQQRQASMFKCLGELENMAVYNFTDWLVNDVGVYHVTILTSQVPEKLEVHLNTNL